MIIVNWQDFAASTRGAKLLITFNLLVASSVERAKIKSLHS